MSRSNQKPEIVAISFMDNLDKKNLLISSPMLILDKGVVDVAIIDTDTYYTVCILKNAQVFAVSMRELEFQEAKKAKPKSDPKHIVAEEYHNFWDVFSKKYSDTLPFYWKYDHKIILEEEQKHGHTPLYKISLEELDIVKYYLNLHLVEKFIQASSAPYLSPVLFVKKSGREIRFCVNYQRLNIITKKDWYPISLIKETLD